MELNEAIKQLKDKIENKIKELEESENVGIADIYEIKKEFAIKILKGLL